MATCLTAPPSSGVFAGATTADNEKKIRALRKVGHERVRGMHDTKVGHERVRGMHDTKVGHERVRGMHDILCLVLPLVPQFLALYNQ